MLVSKVVTITDSPVELLAGEDTSQPYALTLTGLDLTSAWIGGSDVTALTGGDGPGLRASTVAYPLLMQGESLWAVSGSSALVGLFAHTIPE